jgi:hypothetical protein
LYGPAGSAVDLTPMNTRLISYIVDQSV